MRRTKPYCDTELGKLGTYMTASELARVIGLTPRMGSRICAEGKILGAFKVRRTWIIPKSAVHIIT